MKDEDKNLIKQVGRMEICQELSHYLQDELKKDWRFWVWPFCSRRRFLLDMFDVMLDKWTSEVINYYKNEEVINYYKNEDEAGDRVTNTEPN